MTRRINTTTSRDGLCRFILQIILLLTDLKVKSVKHDSSLLSISWYFPCCYNVVLFCLDWFLVIFAKPNFTRLVWLLWIKTMNYIWMIHSWFQIRFDPLRFIHYSPNSSVYCKRSSSIFSIRYRHNTNKHIYKLYNFDHTLVLLLSADIDYFLSLFYC